MKKLFTALFLICLYSMSFGQALLDGTVSATGTIYGNSFYFDMNVPGEGKWNGLIGLSLNTDSLTTAAALDTSYYWLEYWIGGEWVIGDTIQWYILVNDGTSNTWDDSTTTVEPTVHHDEILVWSNDPRFPFVELSNISIDRIRVKEVTVSSGTPAFKRTMRLQAY